MTGMEQLGFSTSHRIGLLVTSVVLLLVVLELVRRRSLKERYALLWLAASGAGLVVGLFPTVIVGISRLFQVQFLTVFFALAFLFLLGLVLTFSVVISKLSERNRELAQEVGLLSQQLGHCSRHREEGDA